VAPSYGLMKVFARVAPVLTVLLLPACFDPAVSKWTEDARLPLVEQGGSEPGPSSSYFCVRAVVGYGRPTFFDRRIQSLQLALQAEGMSEALTRMVTITDLKSGSIRGDLCVPVEGDSGVVLALIPSTAEGSVVAVSKAIARPELNLLEAFAALAKAPVAVGNEASAAVMSLDLSRGIGQTLVVGTPTYCRSHHCNLSVSGPTKLLLAEKGTSLRGGRPVDERGNEAQGVVSELEFTADTPAGAIPRDCLSAPGDCAKSTVARLSRADADRLGALLSAVSLAANASFRLETKAQALQQALSRACPELGLEVCPRARELAEEYAAAAQGEASQAALGAPMPACSVIGAQTGAVGEALARVALRPASSLLRDQVKSIETRYEVLQENCFRERLSAVQLPASWKTRVASLAAPAELGYDPEACVDGHVSTLAVSALRTAVRESATGLLSNPRVAATVSAVRVADTALAESWCVEVERAVRRLRPETFSRLVSRREVLLTFPAESRRDELAAQVTRFMSAESFFTAAVNGEPVLVPMSRIDARVTDLVTRLDSYIGAATPVAAVSVDHLR
jgi:hypothetical protein